MSSASPSRATLADVLAAVVPAPMTERRRQDTASAVRTVARVLGRDPAAIPADMRALNARLKDASPMATGITPARWNNVRSLLRSALALLGPVMKGRNPRPMSKEWAQLYSLIEVRSDQIRVSRLLRWLSGEKITPSTVSNEDLEWFHKVLSEEALLRDPVGTWLATLRAWNRSVAVVVGWPQLPLRREPRANGYTLPWSTFPASLKQDVDGWLVRLSGRDFAEDGPARPLGEITLKSREYQLRAFASALVLRDRDPASLTSLAACLTLDNFTEGLRFFHDRFGQKRTAMVHGLASTLKSVARHWVATDDATLERMKAITRRLSVPQLGLTQKNRQRLLPFNDPESCKKLLALPLVLRRESERGKAPLSRRRVLGEMAVAIEILLFVPIRMKNLAALEIDRHLIKAGKRLLLTIPAAEVKNKAADLDFELPEPCSDLLRWYIREVRTPGAGNPFLFPGAKRSHKTKNALGIRITRTVHRYTGLEVNPHLFRHVGAKLYLDRNPGAYEVVRRVLGHARMDTTTKFYAGLETRSAARHFDDQILKLRNADSGRPK
jgi:integrase